MAYLTFLPGGKILLRLHVQPKASKTRIVGLHDGCLKIAVTAPPIDGKANKAVIGFLADILGLAARDVLVTSGAQSRKKQVVVHGKDGAAIRRIIDERIKQS